VMLRLYGSKCEYNWPNIIASDIGYIQLEFAYIKDILNGIVASSINYYTGYYMTRSNKKRKY